MCTACIAADFNVANPTDMTTARATAICVCTAGRRNAGGMRESSG